MFVGYETNNNTNVNEYDKTKFIAIKIILNDKSTYKFITTQFLINSGRFMISFDEINEHMGISNSYTFNRKYIVLIKQKECSSYDEALHVKENM